MGHTPDDRQPVIDYFSIALTHGLIALACWRLLARADLDDDDCVGTKPVRERPWLKNRPENRPEYRPENRPEYRLASTKGGRDA